MPASVSNPEEALEAHLAILASSGNQSRLDVDSLLGHAENLSPMPDELPDGFAWLAPALAYTFVGMDRSIVKVFAATAVGAGLEVPTLQAPEPVVKLSITPTVSAWYRTLQGIPEAHIAAFAEFVASFEVRNRRNGESTRFTAQRLPRPYRGKEVLVLLPITPRGKFCVDDQGEVGFAHL